MSNLEECPDCGQYPCKMHGGGPATEWKSVALSLRSALRSICYDTTIRTIQDARAVALRAVTNADAELDSAAIEAEERAERMARIGTGG
jgi:hypothetical protein